MDILTAKQAAVLRFLEESVAATGIMPSTRETQIHFGFASQTAAVNHLRALERKGFIQRQPRKARALQLPHNHAVLRRAAVIEIPVFGQIAAGLPELVEQTPEETIRIGRQVIGGGGETPLYALRVRGDSMVGAHITDGDLVILEVRRPRPGDIVAALIDGETTLKRYTVRHGRPCLQAENPRYETLTPVSELTVQGVVQAVVRRYGEGRR